MSYLDKSDGHGYGSDNGSGHGYGDGSGDGHGNGNSHGYGDGYGNSSRKDSSSFSRPRNMINISSLMQHYIKSPSAQAMQRLARNATFWHFVPNTIRSGRILHRLDFCHPTGDYAHPNS